jgi:predicted Zn-dependent protease
MKKSSALGLACGLVLSLSCALNLNFSLASFAQGAASEGYYDDLVRTQASFWPKVRIPLKVYFKDASKVQHYRPAFRDLVLKALGLWCACLGPSSSSFSSSLNFVVVNNVKEANLVVAFTGDKLQMNSAHEGGITQVLPDECGILSAEITFLTVPSRPEVKEMSDETFAHIALHEVGHALGVSGHSQDTGDVMYPSYVPGKTLQALSQRDKDTLRAIYAHPLKPTQAASLSNGAFVPTDTSQKLHLEAKELINKGQLNDALLKLEEAHRLNPTNKFISNTLGSLYCNLGAMAQLMRQLPLAESYFKKSIPLFEDAGNRQSELMALKGYYVVLMMGGRVAEAKAVESKVNGLGK